MSSFDPKEKDWLMMLLDRPIAYHKCFADISGSVVAAVMLSQAVYWTKSLPPEREGWFYKTQQEWQQETGMTRTEQENARRKLKTIGVLEEKKEGVPCKLYFRINTLSLRKLILGEEKIVQIDEFLKINDQSLVALSRTGLMRATKLQVTNKEYVDYREVVREHGLYCHICNKSISFGMDASNISFDHVIPLSEGGGHVFDNIRPSHQRCNQQKGARIPSQSSLSTQINPVCLNKADKDASPKQTGVLKQSKQECFDKADNLYTEITYRDYTENTTEKKEADFVFSEIRDLKDEALDEENINQTDKAKDQDPIPPTPLSHAAEPEKPVKRYADPMGDRFRAKKSRIVSEWTGVLSDATAKNPIWFDLLEPWADVHFSNKDLEPHFKKSLIDVTMQHLKNNSKPALLLDAQGCLLNYIRQNKVTDFRKRIQEAEGIEEADRRLEAMQITKPECVTTYCYLWQPKGKHTDKATGNTTISWDRISIHEPTTIAERDDRQIAILQEFLDKLQARGLVHLAIANKHSLLKGSKVSPIDFHEEVNQVIGICLQQLAQNYQGVAA